MNERVKELAQQVGISYDYLNNTKQWVLIEALAEMIVRECAELSVNSQYANTKSEYYEGFNEALVYAGNKIRKHFGVEE